jgi:hypothetical protein
MMPVGVLKRHLGRAEVSLSTSMATLIWAAPRDRALQKETFGSMPL